MLSPLRLPVTVARRWSVFFVESSAVSALALPASSNFKKDASAVSTPKPPLAQPSAHCLVCWSGADFTLAEQLESTSGTSFQVSASSGSTAQTKNAITSFFIFKFYYGITSVYLRARCLPYLGLRCANHRSAV